MQELEYCNFGTFNEIMALNSNHQFLLDEF